ncbi:hypothetical protein [Bradyrhizobium sp. URHC0002]
MGRRPVKLPRYVHAFIDRHGRSRFYLRRKGHGKVPLPGLPWSPEFMEVYERALIACKAPIVIGASRTMAGTLNAAVVAYYESAAFKSELGEGTQSSQRSLVERFRTEHGDKRLRKLERRHMQAYISNLQSAAVQRNMLRALRHFLKFCKAAGLINHDPSEGVTRQKMKSTGGFYTWTEDDATKYEAHHKIGTMARAAFELYLNLGVRKSDVVRISPRKAAVHHDEPFLIAQRASAAGRSAISLYPLPILVSLVGGPFTADAITDSRVVADVRRSTDNRAARSSWHAGIPLARTLATAQAGQVCRLPRRQSLLLHPRGAAGAHPPAVPSQP